MSAIIKFCFAFLFIFFSITQAQNVSIKIVFTNNFYSQFQNGGVWYKQQNPYNVDNIKNQIMQSVSDIYNGGFGISVSQTVGTLTAYVTTGGSGKYGESFEIGGFINSTHYCEIYCEAFGDTSIYSNDTRLARGLAGTINHELGHVLNCHHLYAYSEFNPNSQTYVDANYYPKNIGPRWPSQPTPIGTEAYYYCIMATQWLYDQHRASNDRYFDQHSIATISFANSGGCYVNNDMVWGIPGKTFNLLNDVTVAGDTKFYIAGSGYTHNLNGKTFSGGTIYQAGTVSGLAAKVKNGSTVKGLFPTIQPAINFASSGNTIEISSGSFNESLSFNSKQGITVVGQGIYSTLLNNQISLVSSSNISLSNFKAGGGIQLNGGSGNTIQNCKIENSGIYLYNSSPTLTGNTIQYCGDGVYADYNSCPPMTNNLIQYNSYGVRCNSGSSPKLAEEPQNANVLRYNTNDAVYAIYGSNPDLGSGSKGGNSIYGNGTPAVSAIYSSYITAANNWWGTATPPQSMFYTYYGSIDHSGELTSNPNYSIKSFDDDSNTGMQAALSYKTISDELGDALDKQKDKRYDEAIPIFLGVFKNNKEVLLGKYALSKIEECFTLAGKKDYLEYSKKEIKPLINEGSEVYVLALELETHQMVNAGMYKEAVNNLQTILKKYNLNTYIEKNTLFRLGAFYSQFFGDKVTADKYFEELKRKYPQDDLVNRIEIVKGFGVIDNGSLQDGEMISFSEEPIVEVEKETTRYVLANYPNPFNPTTTISYSLPQAGHVVLKVYDVLGREVAELANGFKENGKHSVMFNATKYASGFYIYTIRVNDFYASKKMLLTK